MGYHPAPTLSSMALNLHARTTAALTVAIALLARPPAVALGSPAAAATGAPSFEINDVACVNASFCIAVGSSALRSVRFDGSSRTVIERWNGTKWSIVSSPGGKGAGAARRDMHEHHVLHRRRLEGSGRTRLGPDARDPLERHHLDDPADTQSVRSLGLDFAALNDVSCSRTTSCQAVGLYTTGDARAPTLAERWNGAKWSIEASPNLSVGGTGQWLGVVCSTPTKCMAVGQDGLDLVDRPNLESGRWNGTTWTLLTTPLPAKAYTGLSAVSCLSPTKCIAVGWSFTGSVFAPDPTKTLVEHWNGKKWAIIPSSVAGTTAGRLNGISCVSADQLHRGRVLRRPR